MNENLAFCVVFAVGVVAGAVVAVLFGLYWMFRDNDPLDDRKE